MNVTQLSPEQAQARCAAGGVLVDVRQAHERALGMADGSLGVASGDLQAAPGRWLPDLHTPVMLICQSGRRSMQAAHALLAAGYTEVASISGGTDAWRSAGLPLVWPDGPVEAEFQARYARHLRLPEIGVAGQRALSDATVLLVGAGGLGSPAAYYLAAAGVGHLRLVDDDVVERSNLQRQILHTDARIGMPKVASAAQALHALNPQVDVAPVAERLTAANVDALLDGVDVVLDGADNFPVRYLLNAACLRHGKPLVYGAVHRFEGQVSVFDAGRQRGRCPCYRCLFPEPPPPEAAPNCSEVGVLGVLPGVIGLLQATEVLKLLLGLGESLAGRLLQFDALGMRMRQTRLAPDPDCPACAPGRVFTGYDEAMPVCAA